jgi:diaminohydroxyphosphoribosylaminopyrimidine deaminase/5-amino-6-(5-phosphoribosylamino)uracil reductase
LKALYEEGIYSIYLEGGSFSVSRFLKEGFIDNLQIHISNKILGSGLSGFQLSPVELINESVVVQNPDYYHFGDEIMISGRVG